jgi:site-specific recombinase XerD
MMNFQEAFDILKSGNDSVLSVKTYIASEFPATLKAIKLIDQDCSSNKRRKGYNLVRVENKKLGHVYYVRYSYRGKMLPTKFHTHTSILEEAEKFAVENKARLVEQYVRSHDEKMYAILEKFYEANSDYLLCEEKRNHKISERIRKEYHAVVNNRFIPFLKKKNIKEFCEVTAHILGDFQDSLLAEKIKPQSVNNIFKAVKRVFKYLQRKGLLKENPCEFVHYIPVCQEDQKIRGCYEVEKIKGVFNRQWKDDLSYLLCLLIYTTGMRNSEIVQITKDDIMRAGGCSFIDIKKSKTPSGIRLVPLHDYAYRKLLNFCAKKDPKEPIFGRLGPGTFVRANKQLAAKLKVNEEDLEKENITYYSGRHFWKTMMNVGGLGDDIEEIFMGHLVSSNVAKLYNHRDKQGKDRIAKKARQVFKILDLYVFGCKNKAPA